MPTATAISREIRTSIHSIVGVGIVIVIGIIIDPPTHRSPLHRFGIDTPQDVGVVVGSSRILRGVVLLSRWHGYPEQAFVDTDQEALQAESRETPDRSETTTTATNGCHRRHWCDSGIDNSAVGLGSFHFVERMERPGLGR